MAPGGRAGRLCGKSNPIEALAVARAALQEPRLDTHPRPGEREFVSRDTDAQLARRTGVKPLETSSGRVHRHRLNCPGATDNSTATCTGSRSRRRDHPPAHAYLDCSKPKEEPPRSCPPADSDNSHRLHSSRPRPS
jgi:hypothetical protein